MGSLVNVSIPQYWVRALHVALLDQMNRLSAEYRERAQTGEHLTCLERDVDEVANPGADAANQRIRAILFVVLSLAMMTKLNLPMTLTMLPLMPLLAAIQRRFSGLLKIRADETRNEVGEATSSFSYRQSSRPMDGSRGG
jgi:ABC-type multidrug transport system fused ATPase/permease subunit